MGLQLHIAYTDEILKHAHIISILIVEYVRRMAQIRTIVSDTYTGLSVQLIAQYHHH